jgi:pimeloyl-ACP methyl ester carboxylesterase
LHPRCTSDGARRRLVLKAFVEVAGKHLHYVRMGEGPAVVMLHASPCSAQVMAPLQAVFAPRFTTFAFDLPGFGFSDKLDAEPLETAHLADAIAAGVRALGLAQVAAYGRHTGAGVAVEMANRHPDLVSMVVTDGFPVFAQPYSPERLAEYLPPIVPRWDGGHLTWTWFRYREQHVFWPWDKAQPGHRADTEVPDLEFLYRGAVEMLRSGENYPTVYASAFRHAGLGMIGSVMPPVCYGNRPGDSQHKTMPLYPPSAWVQEFARDPLEAAAQEVRILTRYPARGAVPPHRSRIRLGIPRAMDYVGTPDGECFVLGEGLDRPGTPLVLLPELPGSVSLHSDAVRALGQHRPVLAVDPLGNGRSLLPKDAALGVAPWADQVEAVLNAAGLGRVAVMALGTSAAIAVELARRGRAGALVLQSPPSTPSAWADSYAPDITPRPDGGNFLALWHHLRDQELWFPWFAQDPAHARPAFRIEPAALHARAVALLSQPHHYRPTWREVLSHPLDERLAQVTCPVMIAHREADLFAGSRERAATLAGAGAPVLLPDDEEAASRMVDSWLSIAADGALAHQAGPGSREERADAAA